ncbi:MAG TPA: Fur family transcriptional regulator [Candidatus Acidoferrales bacterium]|nr:Fur family transcriptional regulator [Candidatus Acidoferrales bacterium]
MSSPHLQRRSLMQELIAQGVRITSQRRVLIETIQEAKGHIDALTLLAMARKRDASIDRATVYRTIDLLKKRGLIDELDLMHLTGEKHFYEVKTRRDHVHLACFRCGKIEELSPPLFEELKGEMARQSGFEIKVIRLEVGGFCKACAKADRRQLTG